MLAWLLKKMRRCSVPPLVKGREAIYVILPQGWRVVNIDIEYHHDAVVLRNAVIRNKAGSCLKDYDRGAI